jgi:hypothetical protein
MRSITALLRGLPATLLVATAWLAAPVQTAPLPAIVRVAQADQGLNGGWAIDDTGNPDFAGSLTSSLGIVHDAGAGWVRMVFRLGGCHSNWTTPGCNGRSALQAYDQVIANARGQNLRVLGILTGESWPGSQSDWTANNAETLGGNGDNAYVQGFAQQASLLAQHFKGPITDWEVWNEPNAWTSTDGRGHFSGGSYLYPSNYAWLLARSYKAIRGAQPNATVLLGGLFAHEPFGVQTTVVVNGVPQRVTKRSDMPGARRPPAAGKGLTVNPSTTCASNAPPGADSGASYLCATYRVGLSYAAWAPGAYPFDDVGQHLYLGLGAVIANSTLSTYLQDLRQAYLGYEGVGTPKRTQVTEIGWPTDQVSQQVQSDNLRAAFQTLRETNYVGRSYWFSTRDSAAAGLYYGIVDESDVAKLSFATHQQYATFTAPPRPTPPPPPYPCAPRPAVSISATPAQAGQLRVTVTAGSGNLQSIQFGAATNALIDVGQVVGGTGNFSVSFAAGTQQVTFIVRRASVGQSTTVLLTANDGCGAWPTFVGGGPTGF